jgi:CRP-like cAMP-binding protein
METKSTGLSTSLAFSSGNVILPPGARQALLKASAARPSVDKPRIANRMLGTLPEREYRRLLAHSKRIALTSEEVLHDQGVRIRHVYFPIDCTIALLSTLDDDLTLEVGLTGYEGVVGFPPLFGVHFSSVRAQVQSGGEALRIGVESFQKQLGQCPTLLAELHRYTFALLARARLDIACNCFHTVQARLARRLLMASDLALSAEIFVTQLMLAAMLGVRRATVNEAASPLQRDNLIRYARGTIAILDREGLEAVACRCYTRITPPPGTDSR